MSGASEAISPTAHYTGYVWARNGLSHRQLETVEGRILFETLRPVNLASSLVGGPSLERYLLARHAAIDAALSGWIERGSVSQVVEVAAGLSPRGLRFKRRFGDRIDYVEADLPGMAARKRASLERIGPLAEGHRIEVVDVLAEAGPTSLAGLVETLDRRRGLAIVTEGLLGYLDSESVDGVWRRFATSLGRFSSGHYVSDIHLGALQTPLIQGFRVLLSAFVRGRVHLHFDGAHEAEAALRDCGFADATVRRAADVAGMDERGGGGLAHILEASIR